MSVCAMEEPGQALVSPTPAKPKRRLRSNAEKRRIVEETLVEGASVSMVARRHDVNTNLLFTWRRLYRQGLLDACREPASAKLLPVRIGTTGIAAGSKERMPSSGEIEIELPGEVRVRLWGPVDRDVLADVVSVLSLR